MNPSAAAHSILKKAHGRKSVARAIQRVKKRRRSFHRGNPLPAAIAVGGGLLGKLGGIGKRFGPGSDRYGPDGSIKPGNNGPLATTVQAILDKLKTTAGVQAIQQLYSLAHNPAEKHRAAWLAVWTNEIPPRLGQLATSERNMVKQLDPTMSPSAGGGGGSSELAQLANSPLGVTLGKTLIQQAIPRASRARSSRVRQVTRYDPTTGDKYRVPSNSAEAVQWPSRKPSARSLGGVAGGAAAAAPVAAKAAGLAGAGAGAIAGVVIGGLAVGVLIGTGLRKLFGTAKAVRAEEAAVQGALALRNTRTQLEQQLGRKLNATETKALHQEYVAQLVNLGFVQNPQGMWHRPRSTIERILG